MLQAAKCVNHRELAFQTLCQSVQNADVRLPRAHMGFICSALVAMIYEKSAGKEEREEGEEERGVELLKHVCLGGKRPERCKYGTAWCILKPRQY